MSDRYYASIVLGGKIKRSLLPDFVSAITQELGRAPADDPEEWIKEELINSNDGDTLFLDNPEAKWGEFEHLEEWCREHDISYTRNSSQYAEYEPSIAWWHPGMEKAEEKTVNTDGSDVFPRSDLEIMLEDLREFLGKIKTTKDAPLMINEEDSKGTWAKHVLQTGKVDPVDLIEIYLEKESPSVPDLPPLEIID